MSDDLSANEGPRQPSPPHTKPSWWAYIEDETLIPSPLDDNAAEAAEDPLEDPAGARTNLYVGLAVAGLLIGFVVVLLLIRG